MSKHFSLSNWERAFFGGNNKLISDYPAIKVPISVEKEIPSDRDVPTELSHYNRSKLIDLFLLKVSELNKSYAEDYKDYVVINLTKNATVEKREKYGKKYKVTTLNKKSVSDVLEMVSKSETELRNLFMDFKKFIITTKYEIWTPDVEEGEGSGGDGNEGKEGKDSDGNGTPIESESQHIKGVVMSALGETVKWKDSYTYGNIQSSVSNPKLKENARFVIVQKSNSTTDYSPKESLNANRLVSMLDISFDPQSDKVTNLKVGKMDGHKIAEIPAGNTNVHYTIQENQITKPFAVCILMDQSGSMQGSGLDQIQLSIVKMLYKCFSQILPDNKIFVFGHTGNETPIINVYQDNYNQNFEHSIPYYNHTKFAQNYDGPVVERVYERIREQTSDTILFISISDGEPAGLKYGGQYAVQELKKIIEKCKRDDFVTIGLGLNFGLTKEIYNYFTILNSNEFQSGEVVMNVSNLINRVVKTEFQ